MTRENKERVRKEIAKDPKNWVIVDGILGAEISCLDWDKEVEIIYQESGGQPCKCRAICKGSDAFNSAHFIAIDGRAEGNRMSAVIAYRRVNTDDN